MSKISCIDFLTKKNRGFIKEPSDSDGYGFYNGDDGSTGYIYSDGSGYYDDADGSKGYIYSDGSGYFEGADGSNGHIYSDGSGYYTDEDGNEVYFENFRELDLENEESSSSTSQAVDMIAALFTKYLLLKLDQKSEEKKRIKEEKRRELEFAILKAQEEQRKIDEEKKARRQYRRQQAFAFMRKHKKSIVLSLVVLILISCSIVGYRYYKSFIPVGYDSDELIDQNYKDVRSKLYNNGFVRIYTSQEYDLGIDDIEKEYTIKYISINNTTDFSKSTKFRYDSDIEIVYHAVKKISISVSSDDIKGMDYLDLQKLLIESGFRNIRLVPKYDLIFGWIHKEGTVASISINGESSFGSGAYYRPDAEIVIEYHLFKRDKGE